MKNKTVHTPGPWAAAVYKVTPTMLERMTVGSLHHAVCTNHDAQSPNEVLLALCGDESGLDSQSAADARLIAASPEMLDQLKEVRKFLMSYMDGDLISYDRAKQDDTWPHLLLRDIERLIAKAEGRGE